MVVPGAFGIFDRKSVQSVGGYPTDTVTEDLGLTMRLYRKLKGEGRPFTIDFVPASVAWTIVPDKIKPLWQQRERWQRGTLKVLGQYWFFFLNPYYGLLGLVGFPLILLETLFPLIEIACYFLAFTAFFAGVLNWDFLVQGLIAGIALSMLMSAIALFVEELTFRRYPLIRNLPQILLYALIECVGLRHWLLLARIQAFWKVLRRDNQWRSGKITIVKQ